MAVFDIIWLLFLVSALTPVVQQHYLSVQRLRALRALEKRNGSRAITLIHRQESLSFLGIPFARFIDVDDSEAVIRAIEMTSKELPIDLILHTPGGLVLAAEQIACALATHPGSVTVYVPHYAMSGGTMIALAADQIRMSPSAVLGPVDPQIGEYPAASIIAAVARKDANNIADQTLILADVSRKARQQITEFLEQILRPHVKPERAADLARMLSEGRWTHDFPIMADYARELGLPVTDDLPDEVRELMKLYPQPRTRRQPSVEYVPLPYESNRRRIPAGTGPNRNGS